MLREGWWGGSKPGHMPRSLPSLQHIPSFLALGPNDQHFPMRPLTRSSSQSWLSLTRTRSLDLLDRCQGPREAKREPGHTRPLRAGTMPGTLKGQFKGEVTGPRPHRRAELYFQKGSWSRMTAFHTGASRVPQRRASASPQSMH